MVNFKLKARTIHRNALFSVQDFHIICGSTALILISLALGQIEIIAT